MRRFILISSLIFAGCSIEFNRTFGLIKEKIANHKWVVIDTNKTIPMNATLTLKPPIKYTGEFSGFAGCNHYRGKYTVYSHFIHFKIEDIGTNVCSLNRQEQNFLKRLVRTSKIFIVGDKMLILTDKDKNKLLKFIKIK